MAERTWERDKTRMRVGVRAAKISRMLKGLMTTSILATWTYRMRKQHQMRPALVESNQQGQRHFMVESDQQGQRNFKGSAKPQTTKWANKAGKRGGQNQKKKILSNNFRTIRNLCKKNWLVLLIITLYYVKVSSFNLITFEWIDFHVWQSWWNIMS